MNKALSLLLVTVLLSSCTAFGAGGAEEPDFVVQAEDGRVQIRQYGELLVAQTEVEGDYDEISSVAFGRLAGFIFGANQSRQEVAMTAPVLQQSSGDAWVMTFVMPAGYTLETLPRPVDRLVEIRTIPPKRVATLRFSGLMNKKKFDRYSAELSQWIEDNGHTALSPPRSAGYNPPWTLPPLRRNEIHIDVE